PEWRHINDNGFEKAAGLDLDFANGFTGSRRNHELHGRAANLLPIWKRQREITRSVSNGRDAKRVRLRCGGRCKANGRLAGAFYGSLHFASAAPESRGAKAYLGVLSRRQGAWNPAAKKCFNAAAGEIRRRPGRGHQFPGYAPAHGTWLAGRFRRTRGSPDF